MTSYPSLTEYNDINSLNTWLAISLLDTLSRDGDLTKAIVNNIMVNELEITNNQYFLYEWPHEIICKHPGKKVIRIIEGGWLMWSHVCIENNYFIELLIWIHFDEADCCINWSSNDTFGEFLDLSKFAVKGKCLS